MNFSISAGVRPAAKVAPTIAPMLVPVTQLIGTRISSSTLSTPTCAMPRAPPPESASPIRGEVVDTGAGVSAAITGRYIISIARADAAAKDFMRMVQGSGKLQHVASSGEDQ